MRLQKILKLLQKIKSQQTQYSIAFLTWNAIFVTKKIAFVAFIKYNTFMFFCTCIVKMHFNALRNTMYGKFSVTRLFSVTMQACSHLSIFVFCNFFVTICNKK